jgi:hypothetical protein
VKNYQSTFSQTSGRTTVSKPEYLTLVSKWDDGVPPQTLLQWVGGFSLQQVGGTPGVLPTHCIQHHRWYANILIWAPSLKRKELPYKNEKRYVRAAVANARHVTALFSFFPVPLSRDGARFALPPLPGSTAGTEASTHPARDRYWGREPRFPCRPSFFRTQTQTKYTTAKVSDNDTRQRQHTVAAPLTRKHELL